MSPKSHLSYETGLPLPLPIQGPLDPHLDILTLWCRFLASARSPPFVSPAKSQIERTALPPAGPSFSTNAFLLSTAKLLACPKGLTNFFFSPNSSPKAKLSSSPAFFPLRNVFRFHLPILRTTTLQLPLEICYFWEVLFFELLIPSPCWSLQLPNCIPFAAEA